MFMRHTTSGVAGVPFARIPGNAAADLRPIGTCAISNKAMISPSEADENYGEKAFAAVGNVFLFVDEFDRLCYGMV